MRQSGVSAETRRQREARSAQKERSTLDRGSRMGTASWKKGSFTSSCEGKNTLPSAFGKNRRNLV